MNDAQRARDISRSVLARVRRAAESGLPFAADVDGPGILQHDHAAGAHELRSRQLDAAGDRTGARLHRVAESAHTSAAEAVSHDDQLARSMAADTATMLAMRHEVRSRYPRSANDVFRENELPEVDQLIARTGLRIASIRKAARAPGVSRQVRAAALEVANLLQDARADGSTRAAARAYIAGLGEGTPATGRARVAALTTLRSALDIR